MTIKTHITFSATISLAIIALIACQNKTQVTETKEQSKTSTEATTTFERSTKETENIADEEIAKEIGSATSDKVVTIETKTDESVKDIKSEITDNKIKEVNIKPVNFNISDIEKATLYLDVFEVNGGSYSNKIVTFNGISIGLLPNNAENLRNWKTVSINLKSEAIDSINYTNNSVGIIDNTRDLYNLRNICLKIKLHNDVNICTINNTNTFSSAQNWWPMKQGKTIKLDGSSFITLGFN